MVKKQVDEIDIALNRIIGIARANMKREQTCITQVTYKKKQKIPSTVKRLVWHHHIGEEVGKAKCTCCKTTDITQLSFHCGHIIPEVHGGEMCVNNLKPICQNCNSSMGTMNMNEFMMTYHI